VASSNSRFDCLAPIALRLARSIFFQRIILVLCLLHCFMAVYETRPFKEYSTRQKCLNEPVDENNLQKIFISETVILAFYWVFFFAKVLSRSGKIGGWSMLQLFVTTVLTVDLIYNWVFHVTQGAALIRFGTPLRPVIQIVRTTRIAHMLRRHLHELYYTIMSAKYMFAIITMFCVIIGIIMQIFVRTVCAGCDTVGCLITDAPGTSRVKMCALFNTRFETSGSSILTAFVLITASNYNSITEMLVSYMDQTEEKSRALFLFLFLVVVVLIGYFLLFPILLAVVVSSYRKARQTSVDRDNASTQLALASAFSLLESVEDSNGAISERVYFCFMKACNLNFSDKEIDLFFQYLDTDMSKSLSIDEFTQLLDIMSLSLRKGLSKRISHYFINLGTVGKGHILFRNFFSAPAISNLYFTRDFHERLRLCLDGHAFNCNQNIGQLFFERQPRHVFLRLRERQLCLGMRAGAGGRNHRFCSFPCVLHRASALVFIVRFILPLHALGHVQLFAHYIQQHILHIGLSRLWSVARVYFGLSTREPRSCAQNV